MSRQRCIRFRRLGTMVVLLGGVTSEARAYDVSNLQPLALDQPQLNVLISRSAAPGQALTYASTDLLGNSTYEYGFTVYADTGASGVLIDGDLAALGNGLGLGQQQVNGAPVQFHDVGVGGSDTFGVSEPVHIGLETNPSAQANSNTGVIPQSAYTLTANAVRLQVGAPGQSALTGGLNVFGMPVLAGKALVVNTQPLNHAAPLLANLGDFLSGALSGSDPFANPSLANMDMSLHTALVDPQQSPGAVPATNRHVRLSYASFADYTDTTPAGASPPTLAANPFVGPSPLAAGGVDHTPGIMAEFNHQPAVTGSWLLDTGAAISMISSAKAAALGVALSTDGTQLIDSATHQPLAHQFSTTIGGIGGSKVVHGFYLDALTLPTVEGDPIRFTNAPVFVSDISVQDHTGQVLTLDGVLGMNFLVASAMLDQSSLGFDPTAILGALQQAELDLMNDPIGGVQNDPLAALQQMLSTLNFSALTANLTPQASPFDYFVVDNQNGMLGLQLAPEPVSLALLGLGGVILMFRRRG